MTDKERRKPASEEAKMKDKSEKKSSRSSSKSKKDKEMEKKSKSAVTSKTADKEAKKKEKRENKSSSSSTCSSSSNSKKDDKKKSSREGDKSKTTKDLHKLDDHISKHSQRAEAKKKTTKKETKKSSKKSSKTLDRSMSSSMSTTETAELTLSSGFSPLWDDASAVSGTTDDKKRRRSKSSDKLKSKTTEAKASPGPRRGVRKSKSNDLAATAFASRRESLESKAASPGPQRGVRRSKSSDLVATTARKGSSESKAASTVPQRGVRRSKSDAACLAPRRARRGSSQRSIMDGSSARSHRGGKKTDRRKSIEEEGTALVALIKLRLHETGQTKDTGSESNSPCVAAMVENFIHEMMDYSDSASETSELECSESESFHDSTDTFACEEVQRILDIQDNELDHVVLAAPDLEDAIAEFYEKTGVKPVVCASLRGLGIRTARVSFQGSSFLEIIAPDPESSGPIGDLLRATNGLRGMVPFHWAIRSPRTGNLGREVARLGFSPDCIETSSTRQDGTLAEYESLYLYKQKLGGLCPFFLGYGANTDHPCETSPIVGDLLGMTIRAPEDELIHKLVAHTGSSGFKLKQGKPGFELKFNSPKGIVSFKTDKMVGFQFPGFEEEVGPIMGEEDLPEVVLPDLPEMLSFGDEGGQSEISDFNPKLFFPFVRVTPSAIRRTNSNTAAA